MCSPEIILAAEPVGNIFSLSLAELIDVQVRIESVSKRLEGINDAPSVVTVMTSEEIELFGGKDLYEVLGRFVGVQASWRSDVPGRVQIGIRNDQPSGIDYRHTLILLNGSPLNMDSYNGNIWNHASLASLPLDSIEQIELIRGPGSVLHGTTAFQGVVNIVTKAAAAPNSTENFSITAGRASYDAETIRAEWHHTAGEFNFSGFVTGMNSSGERLEALANGVVDPVFNESMHEDNFGVLGNLSYGQWKASAWYGSSDQGSARRDATASKVGENEGLNQRYLANLARPFALSEDWELQTKFTLSGFRHDFEITNKGPRIQYEADEQALEINLAGKLSEDLYLLSGVVATHFSGSTPGPIKPIPQGWSYTWWSAYSQLDYQLTDRLKLTLGGQFNRADTSSEFVPRAGLVFNFNQNWGAKLLYGEAFRSPVAAETRAEIPAINIFGNPDLKPESVATWDMQVFYQQDNAQLALTIFHSQQKDLTVRVFEPLMPGEIFPFGTFENKGSLTLEGVELEGKLAFAENWFVTGGLTTQRNREGSGTKDYTLEPDWEGRLGIGYSNNYYSLGLYDIFRDSYKSALIREPDAFEQLNPDADASHLISLNLKLNVGQLFGDTSTFRDTSLNLHVENLLDQELFVPSINVGVFDANTVPSRGGRVTWLEFKIGF